MTQLFIILIDQILTAKKKIEFNKEDGGKYNGQF